MLLKNLEESATFISSLSSVKPRIGIILGSGLGSFADQIEIDSKIPYHEIPHFNAPQVEGHSGTLVMGKVNDVPVAVMQGRIHFYEGFDMHSVVYPTRTLAKLGIDKLVVTNAAGGIDENMQPGDFMLLNDHINLFGTNPLIGNNENELGPRFPDMSEPYCKELTGKLRELFLKRTIRFSEGVYCGVTGPTYETAAEVRYLRSIGGNAVGMSTVPEVITAKHMGLKVCGISCITNCATGVIDGAELSHDEVKIVAKRVENDFKELLMEFISSL